MKKSGKNIRSGICLFLSFGGRGGNCKYVQLWIGYIAGFVAVRGTLNQCQLTDRLSSHYAWHVTPDQSHPTLQLPALRRTPDSNNLSTNSSNNPMGQHTHTHLTDIFTTQHVSTPNRLLADPPKPNLSPWCSKYHGKFTKSSATSQLQLCLSLLLDTYLPCSLVWYLFVIFTLYHSTFYFYLYISFSSMGSPSFPLWIPC